MFYEIQLFDSGPGPNPKTEVLHRTSQFGQIYDVDSSFSFFERTDLGLASMLSVLISSTFEIESNPFSDQSTPIFSSMAQSNKRSKGMK